MKHYKQVVKERYDRQRYDGKGILDDMYSPMNPVGFYGEGKSAGILADFVRMLLRKGRKGPDELTVCDCGCGDGVKTRVLAELLENPEQVYGVEYSRNRLGHCRSMNPAVHYEYADLTEAGKGIPFAMQFDGITAFVVFMHFSTEQEIGNALRNIHGALKKDGLFLWYELKAGSHWEGKGSRADHWGFSAAEMDRYALEAGFRLVKEYGVYARIPVVRKNALYLAGKVKQTWKLDLLERLPLPKSNLVRIYRKETEEEKREQTEGAAGQGSSNQKQRAEITGRGSSKRKQKKRSRDR